MIAAPNCLILKCDGCRGARMHVASRKRPRPSHRHGPILPGRGPLILRGSVVGAQHKNEGEKRNNFGSTLLDDRTQVQLRMRLL